MPLKTGQMLSHYEIRGPLGAGGMGEVYRARDTRLCREVAIKIVPAELAGCEERLWRFEREARTLASLNHANVAVIHGVDQVDGLRFIAMELVPGEDLETQIARGPLPVDEAIDVCRQIAEGLEAAHEAGVVHRDLKPANVRVTPEGKVKVLDFGLAKPIGPAAGEAPVMESLLATEEGRVLGTPVYMAPEQARGRSCDRRVDVWAFGCVLYECLTGRRAFRGEVLSEVLAAVLERDPDWGDLPAHTPSHVQALLRRCLDKDPRTRLRDIGEARVLLERGPDALAGGGAGSGGLRTQASVVAIVAVAVAAVALGAVGGRFAGNRPSVPERPAFRQQRLTEMIGMEESPAVSPDGGKVVFLSRVNGVRQVFVRLLAQGSPAQLTHDEFDHAFPRWADENTIVYVRRSDEEGGQGSLWTSDFLGSSSPRLLLDPVQGEVEVDHAGRRMATFRTDAEGPALVIREYGAGGAGSETVVRLPGGTYRAPRWSPDDRCIAFEFCFALNATEIQVLDLDSSTPRRIVRTGQTRGLAWLPDGSGLIYSSSAGSTLPYPPVFSLRRVSIDGTGDARLPGGDTGYASFVEPDVMRDSRVVASRVAFESDIYRYPVDGTPRENVAGALRITHQTGLVQVPTASPDGREVAYLSDSGGRANVWVARTDGLRPPRQITDEEDPLTVIGIPTWSPRGDWIAYYKGPLEVEAEQWLVRPDGTGEHFLVQARGGAHWSRDGEWLYFMRATEDPFVPEMQRIHVDGGEPVFIRSGAGCVQVTADGGTCYFSPSDYRMGEVWLASPLDTGEAKPLRTDLQSRIPLWPHCYALSPDDTWLAVPLRDRGTTNLWLISTEDGSMRQVTDFQQRATTIGRQVSWAPGSDAIFAALMETDADIVVLDGVLP